MSNINDVRAGIAAATAQADEIQSALAQVNLEISEAMLKFRRATEGSDKADVAEADGFWVQANKLAEELRQHVSLAISASESVSRRL